jgi:hypothetical protein
MLMMTAILGAMQPEPWQERTTYVGDWLLLWRSHRRVANVEGGTDHRVVLTVVCMQPASLVSLQVELCCLSRFCSFMAIFGDQSSSCFSNTSSPRFMSLDTMSITFVRKPLTPLNINRCSPCRTDLST